MKTATKLYYHFVHLLREISADFPFESRFERNKGLNSSEILLMFRLPIAGNTFQIRFLANFVLHDVHLIASETCPSTYGM